MQVPRLALGDDAPIALPDLFLAVCASLARVRRHAGLRAKLTLPRRAKPLHVPPPMSHSPRGCRMPPTTGRGLPQLLAESASAPGVARDECGHHVNTPKLLREYACAPLPS